MPKKYLWIEQYRGCGCSSEATRKKDLLAYCAIHGSDVLKRYKLPQKAAKPSLQPDAADLRCPYCGFALNDDDLARDGEALYCAECGMRVEYWDALSEAEEVRA